MLITDFAPDMISRSFMFEIPWQFGYGSFALYLIGIAQTLADSHKVIANSWLPSPKVVDAIGGSLLLAPFLINNCISLTAGILAEKNLELAVTFTRLLYVCWFIHCICLLASVLYSGVRLIQILERHLKKFNAANGPRYNSIKTGIFKIRSVVTIIASCLISFAIFLLLFGILRRTILTSIVGSIILGALWNFLGALCTLGVVVAILINPKIDETSNLGLKSSSVEKSSTEKTTNAPYMSYSNFTTQDYSATGSVFSTTIQGCPENIISEELKFQKLQYQQVFQKHNNHHVPHKDLDALESDDQDRTLNMNLESDRYDDSGRKNKNQNIDDEHVINDGETSQIYLMSPISKDQKI